MKKNVIILFAGLILISAITSCKKDVAVSSSSSTPNVGNNISQPFSIYTGLPRTKSAILTYLSTAISQNHLIIGQQAGAGSGTASDYATYVQALNTNFGVMPALVGIDYGFTANNNLTTINQTATTHWNKGGFVEISCHFDNPFETGYNAKFISGDATTPSNIANTDLSKLLINAPSSTAKTNYRTELTKVADALVQLKNAGIAVIWRPFHEMNASWFWWGANNSSNPSNITAYKNLWIDMYNYFNSRGLDNLIWVYCPYTRGGNTYIPAINTFYPGSAYVDVVGVDVYSPTPALFAADYSALQALSKPIVMGEIGPSGSGLGNYNEQAALDLYKGKAAYFIQWSSWTNNPVAIIDNVNANQMLWQTYAICIH